MCRDTGVAMGTAAAGDVPSGRQIYLVDGVRELSRTANRLLGRHCFVFLFDAPPRLLDFPDIEVMDVDRIDIGYVFRMAPMTDAQVRRVRDIVRFAKDYALPPFTYDRERIDIYQMLISEEISGKFLHFLNSLLMKTSNVTTREQAQAAVVAFLFEGKDGVGDELRAQYARSSKSQEFLKSVIDFLESDKGAAMRTACREVVDLTRRDRIKDAKTLLGLDFKGLGLKHGIDDFEIRYLSRIWFEHRESVSA
jgi:hypothetical protein